MPKTALLADQRELPGSICKSFCPLQVLLSCKVPHYQSPKIAHSLHLCL